MPRAPKTCGNCAAYVTDQVEDRGTCHALAPSPLVVRLAESPKDKTHVMWPRVEAQDWCLEWEAKK